MIRAFLIVALLAACNDPPLSLRFRVTDGDEAACFVGGHKVTACEDVTTSCDVIVSLRVFPPSDPTSPVISVCKPPVGERDLCSIGSIDLPPPNYELDEQTLEVQILVYQAKQIPQISRDEWQCPADVMFDAQGFPVASVSPCVGDGACDALPAIGGVAFYHPGDALTYVDLGCVDYDLLNDMSCTGASSTKVSASVDDFDTQVPVSSTVADRLTVAVGQPQPIPVGSDIHYQLMQSQGEVVLARNASPTPGWSGSVMSALMPACIEVSEDVAQSTASVRCVENADALVSLDLTGTRLSRATLEDVLTAIGSPGAFPDDGLVVGVVLDYLGNPRPNTQVTTNCSVIAPCPIQYLNATRDGVVTTGTTTNGIFISRAPFNTLFGATTTNPVTPQLGGKIDGKVTVVILQEKMTTGN